MLNKRSDITGYCHRRCQRQHEFGVHTSEDHREGASRPRDIVWQLSQLKPSNYDLKDDGSHEAITIEVSELLKYWRCRIRIRVLALHSSQQGLLQH